MKRRHCTWTVCGDFWIQDVYYSDGLKCTCDSSFVTKPTIKSAFRIAKKLANQFGVEVEIYNNQDNNKARRLNKNIKVFIVTPN